MLFHISFIVMILGAQAQCPKVSENGCSVCGEGKCVTSPDAVFLFPGQPSVPCGILQSAGLTGRIPLEQCEFLPALIGVCNCGVKEAEPEPTLVDIPSTVIAAGSFEKLVASLVVAELVGTLSDPNGPFTVFAPTDDAFAVLPGGVLECLLKPQSREALTSLLNLHVAEGRALASDLSDGMMISTLNGEELRVDITAGDTVFINGKEVVSADVPASNGIVHVIDSILLPNDFDVPSFLLSCDADLPCPSVPSDGCSVCGPSLCVGNDDAVFEFPGQPAVPCGRLEQAGLNGEVPLDQCGFLPGLVVDICECRIGTTPIPEPTNAPVVAPTDASIDISVDVSCLKVSAGGCSICGPDLCVGDDNAIFTLPGQASVPCGILQTAGLNGDIPLTECAFLPGLLDDICECNSKGSILTASPILAIVAPSDAPTIVPSAKVTDAPPTLPTSGIISSMNVQLRVQYLFILLPLLGTIFG